MRKILLFSMLLLSIVLGGCFNSNNNSSDDAIASGATYYFDEFQDVPVPNEMKARKKDGFITYSSTGTKLGTQCFSGRVEMASLVTAMYGHMQREGWILRSVFRSSRSIMIFEKPDTICSIYVDEGIFETCMLMFVSPKLQEGALQYSVPASTSTESMIPGDPVIGSGAPQSSSNSNVTVYPAK